MSLRGTCFKCPGSEEECQGPQLVQHQNNWVRGAGILYARQTAQNPAEHEVKYGDWVWLIIGVAQLPQDIAVWGANDPYGDA